MFWWLKNLTTRNGMESSSECRGRRSGKRNCLLKSITTHITWSIHQVAFFFLSIVFPGARQRKEDETLAIPVPVTHSCPSGWKFLRPKTNKRPDYRVIVFYLSVVQRIKGKTWLQVALTLNNCPVVKTHPGVKYGSRHETEVSGRLHAPAAVALGMSPGCTQKRRMGGVQRKSGHRVKEINLLILPGIQPQNPGFQPLAWSLYWPNYVNWHICIFYGHL